MSSPKFKILALCLQGGEKTPEGRTKAYKAYGEFKKIYAPDARVHYVDDSGFPVFKLVFIILDNYEPGTYEKAWEAFCKQFELQPASTYEGILDFNTAAWGDYINKNEIE